MAEWTAAFKANDGTLHLTRAGAAAADLEHLAKVKNKDQRGTSLDGPAIAFIIDNRQAVARILRWIEQEDDAVGFKK